MVASLGMGISFSVNGKKHTLDPGLQPCTTLYDFLRGRTTYTVRAGYKIRTAEVFRWAEVPAIGHVSWHAGAYAAI